MTKTDFSDETLMRFADGELDPKTAAEIERAMETDDELVPRVAFFLETRTAAQTALEPLLDEPVPAELTQAIEAMVAKKKAADQGPASVLPFRRPPANDQVVARRWFTPIAASLTAILGGVGGYRLAQVRRACLGRPSRSRRQRLRAQRGPGNGWFRRGAAVGRFQPAVPGNRNLP